MKLLFIVGARPQFIKVSVFINYIQNHTHYEWVLVHTGQHYDPELSRFMFEDLDIPRPDFNLGIGSGSHGQQLGKMLDKLEDVLLNQDPDVVFVFGDTNSTIAGALCCAKMHIPVVHIESGLRSFNRAMPEEINRIVTDHVSDMLFAPSMNAIDNLHREGLTGNMVGDCMHDVQLHYKDMVTDNVLSELNLTPDEYGIITIHRPVNADNPQIMLDILTAIEDSSIDKVVFPVHPRTERTLQLHCDLSRFKKIQFIKPVGYLDFLSLMLHSHTIITDSGGIQKEAYWLNKRCITVREETEWIETVKNGWNILTGSDHDKIVNALNSFKPNICTYKAEYGEGDSVMKTFEALEEVLYW